MSEIGKLVLSAGKKSSAEDLYRLNAVAAAAEVIAVFAASGSTSVDLSVEFGKLSEYADKIQEALKVNAE